MVFYEDYMFQVLHYPLNSILSRFKSITITFSWVILGPTFFNLILVIAFKNFIDITSPHGSEFLQLHPFWFKLTKRFAVSLF